MLQWYLNNQELVWTMASLSLLVFFGSLIVIPLLIARMPADYFLHKKPPPSSWRARHRVLRLFVLAVKNVFGAVLVLTGIALLAFPGQGILTILIGVTLLNFPGKRELELWFVSRPSVLKTINWIRRKAKRPPLILPAVSKQGRRGPEAAERPAAEKGFGAERKPEPAPSRTNEDAEGQEQRRP